MADSQPTCNLPPFPDFPGVEFRYVVGFSGYAVGDDGTVISCLKVSGRARGVIGTGWNQLRPVLQTTGYLHVSLRRGGKTFIRSVHRLVLETFVGDPPDGCARMCGCHGNGLRHDNRLSNLRWGTPLENEADKVAHGTVMRGEKNHAAKLSAADVQFILKSPLASRVIAKELGVSKTLVLSIRSGKSWKHVRIDAVE